MYHFITVFVFTLHVHDMQCTGVYKQVLRDTRYLGWLLPLNISCIISLVCCSVTFSTYYLLLLMLMLVVAVISLLCCFVFSYSY